MSSNTSPDYSQYIMSNTVIQGDDLKSMLVDSQYSAIHRQFTFFESLVDSSDSFPSVFLRGKSELCCAHPCGAPLCFS